MANPWLCGWTSRSYPTTTRCAKSVRRRCMIGKSSNTGDSPGTAEEPAKEAPKDSTFNKGTFMGLRGFMQAQGDTAFLALHEGKTWLAQAFDNGPGGGTDDLNQIHDHDLYKNHPGNTQNRFRVRNPHLCGAVQKPDSTAGMTRFLIGHFPTSCTRSSQRGRPPRFNRFSRRTPTISTTFRTMT